MLGSEADALDWVCLLRAAGSHSQSVFRPRERGGLRSTALRFIVGEKKGLSENRHFRRQGGVFPSAADIHVDPFAKCGVPNAERQRHQPDHSRSGAWLGRLPHDGEAQQKRGNSDYPVADRAMKYGKPCSRSALFDQIL